MLFAGLSQTHSLLFNYGDGNSVGEPAFLLNFDVVSCCFHSGGHIPGAEGDAGCFFPRREETCSLGVPEAKGHARFYFEARKSPRGTRVAVIVINSWVITMSQ